MRAKVVDASVIASIAFGEARGNEAMALINDGELHAPELLDYELANIAWKKARSEPKLASEIVAALRVILRVAIRRLRIDAAEVAELALSSGLSAYDAAYLWAARELGAELITFDATLKKAARRI